MNIIHSYSGLMTKMGLGIIYVLFSIVLMSCGISDSEKVKLDIEDVPSSDITVIDSDARDKYYVYAGADESGDGLSLDTAWKTFDEAISSNSLKAGALVLVYPGTYREALNMNVSGDEIISIKHDVSVANSNRLTFNSTSVDLSSIDLSNDIDEYYLYVFRSMKGNNGVYKITDVTADTRQVSVEGTPFVDESSSTGNAYDISASIGQPIVFINASQTPDDDRVIINASSESNIEAVLYVGDYADPRTAKPVQYTIVDGFEITSSRYSPGVRIQNSSYNTVRNCKIYNLGTSGLENAAGVQLSGSENQTASYNTIDGNTIYNTPKDGVQVGYSDFPQPSNQVLFTHITDNTIYTSGSRSYAKLDNAVDINPYNTGTVIEGNTFQNFNLDSAENGAVNIGSSANYTMVYNNTFKNIGVGNQGTNYLIGISGTNDYVYVYNNLLYNETETDNDLFSIRINGSDLTHTLVAHNTIFQVDKGILLEDYGGAVQVYVYNNIVDVSGSHLVSWGSTGNFTLQNNLYTADPGAYDSESGRVTGDPGFSSEATSDFNLISSSLAVDAAATTSPSITIDFNRNARTGTTDIGAFEYIAP